jgi:hypothetical protein
MGPQIHQAPRGELEEPRQPQQQEEGEGGAFPRVDREVNIIFGGHGSQENRRQQKLYDRQILVATTGPPAPYRWSEHPITFTRADQWLNFDHPVSHPFPRAEPGASHMCARIYFHTYVDVTSVIYQKNNA